MERGAFVIFQMRPFNFFFFFLGTMHKNVAQYTGLFVHYVDKMHNL